MQELEIPEQIDTPLVRDTVQTPLVRQAIEIWMDGGWAMAAIAMVGIVLFAVGVMTYIKLMGKRFEWAWRSAVVLAVVGYIAGFVNQVGASDMGQTAVALFEAIPQIAYAALLSPVFHVMAGTAVLWWLVGSVPRVEIYSKFAGFLAVGGYLLVFLIQAAGQSQSFTPFIVSLFQTAGRTLTDKYFLLGLGVAGLWAFGNWAWAFGVNRWPKWVSRPDAGKGPVGRLVAFAMRGSNIEETGKRFDEMRVRELKPFDREMLVMRVCIAAAPLLGLLGTVTGMVATFDALNQGSGGDETQQLVSDGISVALITTETGLVIALAGLFFQYQLSQKHQRYKAFIAHMETVCTQAIYHKNLKKRA